MVKVENTGLNNSQGWEKERTKGRIITKGGKKEKTQGLVKTREGILSPVLIITQGFVFGS